MDKLFVDTDISLDLLMERRPFYSYAAQLFTLADKQKIKLYTSAICFNNLDYILSKHFSRIESRQILSKFKILVNVLAVDEKIINLALSSKFTDFEDAIQYYTALENNLSVLVTRNLQDYKHAAIPIVTAEVYLRKQK